MPFRSSSDLEAFATNMGHVDGLEVAQLIRDIAKDNPEMKRFEVRNKAVAMAPRLNARLDESHRENNTLCNSMIELPPSTK